MRFTAAVTVGFKSGVLDPQAAAVGKALAALGYRAESLAVGKRITFELEASDRSAAAAQAEEMARRVLANPVLETFTVDLQEVS